MAPALIIGLDGRPVTGSRLIALKASPLGSAPTCASMPSRPSSAERECVHEGLGNRLEGERHFGVPGSVQVADQAHQGHAEVVRVCPASSGM